MITDKNKIIEFYKKATNEELYKKAADLCKSVHGENVLLRGLIEFSNHCTTDCLYCGIRKSNANVHRYRLSEKQIMDSVKNGFGKGIKTFVLQSGEDPFFSTDVLCSILENIKSYTGDAAAVTLSCGIRSKESYKKLKAAGADRYLIRFETSDPEIHKEIRGGISLDRRLKALNDLKELDYETGSGYMTGLPGETEETRIKNAELCHELQLDMVGIGPFIPHPETPLAGAKQNPLELTIRAAALVRLLLPNAHIPATTAAGSLVPDGREQMIKAGANVLMPNVTPVESKKDYLLYPGKICLDESGIQCVGCLSGRMTTVNRKLSFSKGSAIRVAMGQ